MEILCCLWDSSENVLRINIHFSCSLVWHTTVDELCAAPSTLPFCLMTSWERRQWSWVSESDYSETLSIWLQRYKHTYQIISKSYVVITSFPLWYACYFLLLDAELSGLQHLYTSRHFYTVSIQCVAVYSLFLLKVQCCSNKSSKGKD